MNPWLPGCSAKTSISGNGCYRQQAEAALTLCTSVWRNDHLTTIGAGGTTLFSVAIPPTHQAQRSRTDWVGRTHSWSWRGGDLTVDTVTTLPGPLLSTAGSEIRLVMGVDAPLAERLDAPAEPWKFHSPQGLLGATGWKLILLPGTTMPVLIVVHGELLGISATNYSHWEFRFATGGGRLLVVPLLDAADIPRDAARQAIWAELVARPPLTASERFRLVDHQRLDIECSFGDTTWSPISMAIAALGENATLVTHPGDTVDLCRGAYAPFRIRRGSSWQVSVDTAWMRARLVRHQSVTSNAPWSPVPEELAYAGDATWEPGTCMDQLLSLRTWAPLLDGVPDHRKPELLAKLTPPTAAEVQAGVEVVTEAFSGLTYGRWRSMWEHCGDVSWDIDWYNGLALSGLERATRCSDPTIAAAAVKTVKANRQARAELANYFSVFHDWSWSVAWIDPRGKLWNGDCIHNGFEGMLAEARLRREEDDAEGAAWMTYLAARTAIGLMAGFAYPEHLVAARAAQASPGACTLRFERMITWGRRQPMVSGSEERLVAVQCLVTDQEVSFATPVTRNPYHLAGNFPEWNALLRSHLGETVLLRWADDFARTDADRHRDWMSAYTGPDWRQRLASGDQEAREQAAVFYQVAPEVALRRLALDIDPAVVERRWATPLPLAEQTLLRGGYALQVNPPMGQQEIETSKIKRAAG